MCNMIQPDTKTRPNIFFLLHICFLQGNWLKYSHMCILFFCILKTKICIPRLMGFPLLNIFQWSASRKCRKMFFFFLLHSKRTYLNMKQKFSIWNYMQFKIWQRYIYTIVDLLCENESQINIASKAKLCEMLLEGHFEHNITTIICLSTTFQGVASIIVTYRN